MDSAAVRPERPRADDVRGRPTFAPMDIRIEVVFLGVTDPARSLEFYERAGFVIDFDRQLSDELWFVQATPPGSACSIAFGRGITAMEPGAQKGIMAVVDDADAARQSLLDAGVNCTDVDEQAWGRFVSFADPDGNIWRLQQLPSRGQ